LNEIKVSIISPIKEKYSQPSFVAVFFSEKPNGKKFDLLKKIAFKVILLIKLMEFTFQGKFQIKYLQIFLEV